MKKLGKVLTVVAAGIGAIKLIEQGNSNARAIERLHERNNELVEEIYNVRRDKSDLQHQINMMKIDVDYNQDRIRQERKEVNELGSKVFNLEMDNIGIKGAVKRAAKKTDSIEPEFYTDRIKAKKEAQAIEKAVAEETATI